MVIGTHVTESCVMDGAGKLHRHMDLATSFARRLPRALEELPADCRCLVVLKSAVAGPTARTLDLTPVLKTKVDAR